MNEIILYTLNCPKCKVLELKLKQKNINFNIVSDVDEVVKIGKAHNIDGAPILQVNESFFDFSNAIKYINEVK